MISKQRQELKKITAPVEEMIRGLSDTHDHDNIEIKRKIRQQGEEVNKEIDQYYDGVIQKLMEQKEQLKQQVHDTVSQKVKAVTIQLEEVEYAQPEVLCMKELNDAMDKSSDQEVLSIKEQAIDRTQQITDKFKRINIPPVQQSTLEFVPTREPFPQFGFLYSIAKPYPDNCEMFNLPKYFIKGIKSKFTIITKDEHHNHCSKGGSQVSVQLEEVNGTIQVRDNNDGSYTASLVPQKVGEVNLSAFVNGRQIKGSPYSVMVRDYISINKTSKIVNNDGNMGNPWGIAFGKNGIWAVADKSKNCVYLFNSEDKLVRSFGTDGCGIGQFHDPAGVAFDSDDHLYVVEFTNHRVQKFTTTGEYLLQFGGEGSGNGKLNHPIGVTVHDHLVYVAEYANKRVSVFQSSGKFCYTIRSEFVTAPHDVTVTGNNYLLVLCNYHHCVYTFTLDGDYLGKPRYGRTKGTGEGELMNPRAVAVDLYGFTLVADTPNHRVSIFDKDGNYTNCFGSEGSAIGQFQRPYGIAVSPNGNIYVSDCINKRIQIFSC